MRFYIKVICLLHAPLRPMAFKRHFIFKSNIFLFMHPDHQTWLRFIAMWKARLKGLMQVAKSKCSTHWSKGKRSTHRREMFESLSSKNDHMSKRMTKPSISIAINNHLHNCYEERNVQLTLIHAKPLTHSLKWITRMLISIQGIFHFLKAKNQGKYTCPKKYQGKYTYPNTFRASILTLGQVYLP